VRDAGEAAAHRRGRRGGATVTREARVEKGAVGMDVDSRSV